MDSADAFVKGTLTVIFLYVVFAVCRWIWRVVIRGAKAVQRHAPDALEGTARGAGKVTKQASALGSKLKKAFDEGRKQLMNWRINRVRSILLNQRDLTFPSCQAS